MILLFFLYFHNNTNKEVIFYTYGTPITKLVGTSILEDDLYEVKDPSKISKVILHTNDDLINRVQELEVVVRYKGLTFRHSYDFVWVDHTTPIIEINLPTETLSSTNFNVDTYLKIYDPSTPQQAFTLQNETQKYYGIAGYTYTCQDTNSGFVFTKGTHQVNIVAWDGHGNETKKTIELILT